jgi:hypothetical protein
MLKPILAATAALGLAIGLAACDKGGQEQAQSPNKSQSQQQGSAPSTPPTNSNPEAQPPANQPPMGQAPSGQAPSGSSGTSGGAGQ